MKHLEHIDRRRMRLFMDKKIKSVRKLMDKKLDKLVAIDKPRDKKIKKCDMMMKGKKK